MPGNFLTKKALDLFRVSRHRAPRELREIGFQRIGFSVSAGSARVILHKGVVGAPSTRFNASSGNIATVRLGVPGARFGPVLAVFDTGRGRINATRIPSPASLDDPDSPVSVLAQLAPEVLKVGARVAGVPQVGGVLATAFPLVTQQARRMRGTAAAEDIRIADLGSSLSSGEEFFARTGRGDREFDPPLWTSGAGPAEQWQHVVGMLDAVARDVDLALKDYEQSPDMSGVSSAGRTVTRYLIEADWQRLLSHSLTAFRTGKPWPLALNLLGIDDGAAQYVCRVAEGREP